MTDKRPRRSMPWADAGPSPKRARTSTSTSPKDELEDMIEDNEYVRAYVTYQWNFNRDFQKFDSPTSIIDELSRSATLVSAARKHTIHKRAMETLGLVRSAIADHNHWTEVWGGKQPAMPRIPTSARLQALRYLDLERGVELDAPLSARFHDTKLRWHLNGTRPPPFWEGAKLDDPDFRDKHMTGVEPSRPPTVDGKRLVALIRAVFPTRPAGVEVLKISKSAQGQAQDRRASAPAIPRKNATIANKPSGANPYRRDGRALGGGGSSGGSGSLQGNSTARPGARPATTADVVVPERSAAIPPLARPTAAPAIITEHEATILKLKMQLADRTARLTRAEAELRELEEDFEDLAGEAGEGRDTGAMLLRRRLDRLETKHKERDFELLSLRHLLATVQEKQVEERMKREQLEHELAALRQQQPHVQSL